MNLLCRFSHLACMTYETSWGSKHFMSKASNSPSKQQTLHLVKGLITNDFYHLFCIAGSPTVIFPQVLCPGCAHIKQLFLLSPAHTCALALNIMWKLKQWKNHTKEWIAIFGVKIQMIFLLLLKSSKKSFEKWRAKSFFLHSIFMF